MYRPELWLRDLRVAVVERLLAALRRGRHIVEELFGFALTLGSICRPQKRLGKSQYKIGIGGGARVLRDEGEVFLDLERESGKLAGEAAHRRPG